MNMTVTVVLQALAQPPKGADATCPTTILGVSRSKWSYLTNHLDSHLVRLGRC